VKKTILALIVVVVVIGAAAGYMVLKQQPQPTPSPGDDYGFGNYLDGLDNYLNDFAGDENIGFENVSDLGGLA